MRCDSCQATNPDNAVFCGQCYSRFEPESTSAAPAATQALGLLDSPETGPPDLPDWLAVDDSPDRPAPVATHGRFTVDGESARWTCVVCGEHNLLTVFDCTVCGTRMDIEEGDMPDVDWAAAQRLETMVPGLGHMRAGAKGIGYARAGIVAVWALMMVALGSSGAPGLLTAAPLLVGIIIVWVTGPADLASQRTGRDPRLNPRRFLYLVVGVIMGVITLGGLSVAL